MSLENIRAFYRELECNRKLRAEALELQKKYARQEDVIAAFIALGATQGYSFNAEELIRHIYSSGKPEK